jgi:hypothetical protein
MISTIVRRFTVSGSIIWGIYSIFCFVFWTYPLGVYMDYSTGELNYSISWYILRILLVIHIFTAVYPREGDQG